MSRKNECDIKRDNVRDSSYSTSTSISYSLFYFYKGNIAVGIIYFMFYIVCEEEGNI